MRKYIILFTACLAILFFAAPASAGDVPVNDYGVIRNLLFQPDMDFSLFIGDQLCDAFIYLINEDESERVVHSAIKTIWVTGDERSVEYLVEYLEDEAVTMDCLYGLGHFSTVESYNALTGYLDDEDEFNRRFAAQSLGELDFTVSDEMWALRDDALALLNGRLAVEKQDWIHPIIKDGIAAVASQERDESAGVS